MENAKLTVSTQEIQTLTGLSRDQVFSLIRQGKLPNVGTRRRFIVPKTALLRYLEQAGKEVQ
jgi:excisionase family DNA binding protein